MLNQKLIINEASFAKTSKKLLKQLNSLEQPLDFKMTQIQELLAKSLGFRNVFELQKSFKGDIQEELPEEATLTPFTQELKQFSSKEIEIKQEKEFSLFKKINHEQAIKIIQYFMHNQGKVTDMLSEKAFSLLSVMMKTLVYLRDIKEITLNINTILEYSSLNTLINTYKRKDFPKEIQNDLYAYLKTLPTFQISALKQNDTVLEQHGYLQMQLLTALNKLRLIEKEDLLIVHPSWFRMSLKEKIVGYNGNEPIKTTVERLTISHPLDKMDLEDTWLVIPEYEEWISSLYTNHQLTTFYFSDLLIYSTQIISPMKKSKINLILNSLLDNYSLALSMSHLIQTKMINR